MRWMTGSGGGSARRRGGAAWRRRAPAWLYPAARAGVVALGFGVAFAGPAWLWRAGWLADALDDLRRTALTRSADIGLTVQNILVEGRVNASSDSILAALGLRRDDPILDFDAATARRRIERLPWVRWATVERRLPDTVLVRIVERRPMALWQRNGRLVVVDDEGVVVASDNLGRFSDLVILVGGDAPAHAPSLLSLLAAQPAIGKRVRAAVRIGARRWNVHLDNGIDVRLPERDASAAWARLARLDRHYHLLARDLRTIDLRLPDRLILRRKPPDPPDDGPAGKNT